MAVTVKMLGAARALVVLGALLAAGARADKVTWDRCKDYLDYGERYVTHDQSEDTEAETLEIKNCQITEISYGDLNGTPNLRRVWMNDNKIQKLDPRAFLEVPQVTYLFLNNNSLSEVPLFGAASVLKRLQTLNLAHNQIRRLHDPTTFSSMTELHTLNLGRNLIEYINPGVFQGLSHLETIYLNHNKLTYIPDRLFAIPTLGLVDLQKNFIEYVSPGAFSGTKLEYLNLNDNKLTHLPDHFVSGLTSTGGKLKSLHFHNNPLQCPCLSELILEVRQVDGCDYASELYTAETPMCEQTNDSQCKRLTEAEYISRHSV